MKNNDDFKREGFFEFESAKLGYGLTDVCDECGVVHMPLERSWNKRDFDLCQDCREELETNDNGDILVA